MLRVLLASQPARAGWLGGTTFSTATHGALIALAIVSSGSAVATVHEQRAADALERITYVAPSPLFELRPKTNAGESHSVAKTPEATAHVASISQEKLAAIADVAAEAAAAVEIPDVTAATDLTAVTAAWLAEPDGLAAQQTSLAEILGRKSGFTRPANGIYTADLVERSVEPKRGNPKPRYPSALASLGVEGTFLVRFVVDSTGDVPEDKIEFPNAMHRLFAAAVRTALLRSHYSPAMIGGHMVPQEVVQEFRFEIGRRR